MGSMVRDEDYFGTICYGWLWCWPRVSFIDNYWWLGSFKRENDFDFILLLISYCLCNCRIYVYIDNNS